MPPQTFAPIAQALVRILRNNSTLKAAVTGFWEGQAPNDLEYPFLTYQLLPSGRDEWAFGSLMKRPRFTVSIWGTDQVQARNLDQLISDILWDADLAMDEQSTMLVRRVEDISMSYPAGTGRRVYQVGGDYTVWTDQTL